MTDITHIKSMLNDRAVSVAEKLLPAGKLISGEWCVGSIHGEAGKSLKICVKGGKLGVWQDFAEGSGGDLIDLWCSVSSLSVPEALTEIKQFLGVSDHQFNSELAKKYNKPQKVSCVAPRDKVFKYLCNDRALPVKALEAYKIGESGEFAFFPFIKSGETHLIKRYPLQPDEKGKRRPVPTEKDCMRICFGWQAIEKNARTIVITEGEIDAMSMWAYGLPAVSVPFGGGGGQKQNWIENDFSDFERFEKIYLALDMDEEGETAAKLIASRLGIHRCFRVSLPLKDANECLTKGISAEEVSAAITNAQLYSPKGIDLASAFEGEVIDLLHEASRQDGATLPFSDHRGKVIFRPGEVTVWGGITGHGKTQMTSFCAIDWVIGGHSTCIASLEMKASRTLLRMCKQVANRGMLDNNLISQSLSLLGEHNLVMYDRVGKINIEELLEVFEYARARYGCTQFVIDSLMRLGVAVDDYNGQEAVMFKLVNWALENNVHVHLVAHVKKGTESLRGGRPPSGDDVKGAMEVTANAANVLLVWRNKAREEKMASGSFEQMADAASDPAVVLNIDKQRNGDFEGPINLDFDTSTYQYHGKKDSKAGRCFIQYELQEDAA